MVLHAGAVLVRQGYVRLKLNRIIVKHLQIQSSPFHA